jgi:uncharacterized protein YbaP (TraB family)
MSGNVGRDGEKKEAEGQTMTPKRASRALSGSVARSRHAIWCDRISEGDRRRRSAVAIGAAH